MLDYAQLWQAVLAELELLVSRANFSTWFKDTSIASYEEGRVVIRVPNAFTQGWLEKKYHPAIMKALSSITNETVREIIYKVEIVRSSGPAGTNEGLPLGGSNHPLHGPFHRKDDYGAPSKPTISQQYGINSQYTFDSFIVGKSNELAHAACLGAAADPGKTYNPIFIYGGVGLGKTHLLHAMGNKIIELFPNKKILYATFEKFTNEFIHAVRGGKGKEFNDVYRGVDVLMVDDIQFLTGKEGTQDAFFHTFNELHQQKKQLVISSDRPPKAINGLEARLLSRFEWGMIADVSQPDIETRIAILERKCQEHSIVLSHDILTFIAQRVQNNIRELEGALNRILAHRDLHRIELTLESIASILTTIQTSPQQQAKRLNLQNLINTIASYYDLTIEDLMGKSRMKRLALPRQIMMYLMREEMKSSFPTIGQEVGGRDHTTAIHAYEKITKEIQEDEKMRTEVELLKQKLYALAPS